MEIRVRYCETDAMGFLHHSQYLNYFEMGRTELFRRHGGNYREMEESGLFLVVVKMNVHYKAPARYDDVLTLKTEITRRTHTKLIHEYEVFRDDLLLTKADSVLACIDRAGRVQRVPGDETT